MPDNQRRHLVYFSDRELVMLDRAIRGYAQVLAIQTAANTRTEANDAAHVSSVVQGHYHCTCPVPQGGD